MVAERLCGTPFWNSSASWDAEKPHLTQCFQNLILVIGSCGVLWLVAPFEFVKICKLRKNPTPWTKLSICKIVCKSILLLVCLTDLTLEIYSYVNNPESGADGLISSIVYLSSIVLTVILTVMCQQRGLRTSLVLPSFWMISTISTIIEIYNDIQYLDQEDWTTIASLVDDSLEFVISIISLILSCISEKPSPSRGRQYQKYCPLEGVSLASRLTFTWLLRILVRSVQTSLHQDHLTPLCYELKSSTVSKKFVEICNADLGTRSLSSQRDAKTFVKGFRHNSESHEENEIRAIPSYPKGKSLLNSLLKISKKFIVIASLLELVYTTLYFLPVWILSVILRSDKTERDWHNYIYAAALFFTLLLLCFADSQRKYHGLMAALRIKTALMSAIYEKALKISPKSETIRKAITSDVDKIFKIVCVMSEIWGASLRLLIGAYILWNFLGSSCFAGLAAAVILIPIDISVEHRAQYYQQKAGENKSERLKILSECLHGMKLIKFYAWEDFFMSKIISLRKLELNKLRKAEFLKMTFKFFSLQATSLVTLATIAAYVLMGNSFNAETIFVSYAVIWLLNTPFRNILHLLAYFVEGLSTVSRIQNFLETKELDGRSYEEVNEGWSVMFSNAFFSWEGKEPTCLRNLNLRIPKGSLIAVVGGSQSGKSSLLRALLGEMEKAEGTSSVKGQIAFVAEKAWIQNTTLEKNILFVNPKIDNVYHRIIDACGLIADINHLPAGEETEIGEKGIPLTEDQKLKVDLARAVYQNADIYLLDDPLRYLETSLAEHLYHRIVGRSGLLKSKTRILATAGVEFLPLVDFIVFLKDGRIVEQGTYSHLRGKNGHFTEYLKTAKNISSASKVEWPVVDVQHNNINTEKFGKQCDLWFLAAGVSPKMQLDNTVCSDTMISSKGLGSKLGDYVKTVGYILTTLSFLTAGLACSCEAASGLWLSEWSDREDIAKGRGHNLLVYSGFIFTQAFFIVISAVTFYFGSTIAAGKLHKWLLFRVMRAPQVTFETTPSENIIRSFDTDLHFLDEKIPESFYVWLVATLRAPALLVVVFLISPLLAVYSIPLVFAFLVVQKLYLNAWKQLQHLTVATSCPLSNLLTDTLQGLSQLRASKASSHFLDRFRLKLDTHNNCIFHYLLASRWLSCNIDIIGAFLVLLTTAMTFNHKDKGYGFYGLAIVLSMQVGECLKFLVHVSSLLNIDLTALDRLTTFSQMKQESEWENPANRPPDTWPDSGSISVQNLSTDYGEGLYPALHNTTLSIKPGEKVAIVGKEESGLYTFLYSLFRLIEPSEGQIVIDNVDINEIGLRDLRSRLAIVPQNSIVFNGTMRQNLDPGDEFKDEDLWSALEAVNLKTYVPNLDCAVEKSMCAEKKYRLSVARCILKKPKIVIFYVSESSELRRRRMFEDSTVLTFSSQDISEHDGRIIRISTGEVVENQPGCSRYTS